MSTPDPRAVAAFNEAVRLREAGRPYEALACYLEAEALTPGSYLPPQHVGGLLTELGQLAGGEAAMRRALLLNPGDAPTHHSLAVNLMSQGRLVEAFPHYRARYEIGDLGVQNPAKTFPFPRWEGEPLTGKRLTIFPEQGAGDQLMFARFTPALIQRGVQVTLLTAPVFAQLFRDSFGPEPIVVADGPTDFPDPDYWISSSDAAAAAGASYADLPRPPYLRATLPAPELPAGFRVGLVTAGNPRFRHDARRSLPEAAAEALARSLPGAVIPLAPEATGARDYAETAAIVRELDLVVTVDTSVAHLAGAMDKRVFVLVSGYGTDWRWRGWTDGTPWYPNTRVFRSTLEGDWLPAVEDVVAAAREMAG